MSTLAALRSAWQLWTGSQLDENPVRHKRAVLIGKGVLVPAVVLIILMINLGYGPND